jgi:hypothetical protein
MQGSANLDELSVLKYAAMTKDEAQLKRNGFLQSRHDL